MHYSRKFINLLRIGTKLLVLTLVLLNCLFPFFIHLKLELLTQFPASNDEKYIFYERIAFPINND